MDQKPNDQAASPDALETPPQEGAQPSAAPTPAANGDAPKKLNPFKAFLRKFNLYLALFIFIVVVASAIAVVSYLNSKKAPVEPTINSQSLTTESLKQLANSNATVGSSAQTLTIQGNAIIAGQTLIRSDLNVAGTLKLGGELLVSSITASEKANLPDTQINKLQVAQDTTLQGNLIAQKDITVAGVTSLNGPVKANQLTVTNLILSGNATVMVPNHLNFTGVSPARVINAGVLGVGGSASVNGSDTTGSININTGSNPVAGCFVVITFSQKFSSMPHVIISPINSGAGMTQYYATRSTTGFSVCTINAAPANQTFGFDYFVTGT